jgi:hypothetical protein
MLSTIWNFLKDGSNQAVLSWIAGGIAAVAAGIWAIIKFMAKNGDQKPSQPSISADHGSMAAGRDISVNARSSSKRSKR